MLALLGRKVRWDMMEEKNRFPTLEVEAGRYHPPWTNKTNCIPPQAITRAGNDSLEGSGMGWDRIGELGFRRLGELGTRLRARLRQVQQGLASLRKGGTKAAEASGHVKIGPSRSVSVCKLGRCRIGIMSLSA